MDNSERRAPWQSQSLCRSNEGARLRTAKGARKARLCRDPIEGDLIVTHMDNEPVDRLDGSSLIDRYARACACARNAPLGSTRPICPEVVTVQCALTQLSKP